MSLGVIMIILIGPSASGKTAVGRMLERKYNIKKVVTYTTRPPRIGEVEGLDYHFLNKQEFLTRKDKNFFFETVNYNDNYYGTSLESLDDSHYIILDINGYNSYKKSDLKVVPYFLYTSKETRRERMIKRLDNPICIEERLSIDDTKFDVKLLDENVTIIDANYASVEEISDEIFKDYQSKLR